MDHTRLRTESKLIPLRSIAAIILTALIATAGCGGATDGRIDVSGTVTIDGTPLPSGSITFYQGGASSGVGTIDNGNFSVSQSAGSEGMKPGAYEVAIQSWEVEPFAVDDDGNMGGPGKSRIPEKYNSTTTSELLANITEENSDLEFFLSSE